MKIALTYTGSKEKHNNYVQWLKSGDDTIEVVTIASGDQPQVDLSSCDALVLSGGVDMHPSFYGGHEDYENAPDNFESARDTFEIDAYRNSQQLQLPVLAVCRGMQLVNCVEGGDLVQDLGKTGNSIHRAVQLIDKAHGATVETGTLLAEIVGEGRVIINSAHHQAVGNMATSFNVSARADDGTIEAMERKQTEGAFLLCIQWHPERMYKFQLDQSPVSKAIRNRFIEEINKNKNLK